MSRCSYLNACITEALRLSPPTVGAPWREVRQEGHYVDGNYLPKHYEVAT